jgi:hypothetical protein
MRAADKYFPELPLILNSNGVGVNRYVLLACALSPITLEWKKQNETKQLAIKVCVCVLVVLLHCSYFCASGSPCCICGSGGDVLADVSC